MDRPATRLRIGDWCVDAESCQISRDEESARVEVRTMRLLLCLAQHAGEVVSSDDLLDQVWSGVTVTQDSVYQAVTSLRRLLGDDPRKPTYIATVPRLGYRLVAAVTPWTDSATTAIAAPEPVRRRRAGLAWAAAGALCLVIAAAFLTLGKVGNSNPSPTLAPRPQKSIAVLPFLDLTETMNEEPFADGMTVELIDKLSKVPGLRVHAPMSASLFKPKQNTMADIARMLSVAYLLEGSVRKSGPRLRVAVRLIRADNEYVVWSETYDRPVHDVLMVQDDIAGEVTKALRGSVLQASPKG
jgi:TolB-like protein/DNA-binding winged helix-turn-helix (wHTH) protein